MGGKGGGGWDLFAKVATHNNSRLDNSPIEAGITPTNWLPPRFLMSDKKGGEVYEYAWSNSILYSSLFLPPLRFIIFGKATKRALASDQNHTLQTIITIITIITKITIITIMTIITRMRIRMITIVRKRKIVVHKFIRMFINKLSLPWTYEQHSSPLMWKGN